MSATLQGALALRTYQRADAVAAVFGKLTGRTVNSAHQQLLKLKREYPLALRAHVEVGALDRLERFDAAAMAVRESVPVIAAIDAHLAEEPADGQEDALYAQLQADPTSDAKRRKWIRAALAHIRALQTKVRAEAAVGGLTL